MMYIVLKVISCLLIIINVLLTAVIVSAVNRLKDFFIIKTHKMSGQLDGIAADLQAASEKLDAIQADEAALHAQIAALSDAPTPEEIANLKSASEALLAKATSIDDAEPDAGTPEDTTEG